MTCSIPHVCISNYLFFFIICNAVALSAAMSTSNASKGPVWCEDNQIYIGGVPENEEVKKLIEESDGHLRVFGSGSLCWNPGSDGALSHPGVSQSLGRVQGYKRVWAQRSTDHRGSVNFPGIVCTLLTKQEHATVGKSTLAASKSGAGASFSVDTTDDKIKELSGNVVTQGMIFNVPPELVQETLEDLDFREKGGYARDVCDVVEDKSQKTYRALLYRGTPDNPAFSSRALVDLPFSAAIMSVSIGPSG